MATKCGDRFYPTNGLSKEDIARDLVSNGLRPEIERLAGDDENQDIEPIIEAMTMLVERLLTDERCLMYVAEHEDAVIDNTNEDISDAEFVSREMAIDKAILVDMGLGLLFEGA